LKLYKISRRK